MNINFAGFSSQVLIVVRILDKRKMFVVVSFLVSDPKDF